MAVSVKDQLWEAVFDRIARITDKRGRRIDPGIMGLVLALNAHKVRTTQSCEGHMTHGFSYPWILIKNVVTLGQLLEAFYMQRTAPYDTMLTIEHLLTDEYRLRPHGGILQEKRDTSAQIAHLAIYQTEVLTFAEYLRDRFFEVEI